MEHEALKSGLSLLVDWANNQDHWARALTSEIIKSRKPISDGQAKHLYDTLLLEKELKKGDAPANPLLKHNGDLHEDEEPFTLIKLSGVQRVNALAVDQELDFNPRITVLFGENGAGKSGYVRILKSIASVRTAEAILPNVFGPPASGEPHASFTYRLGEQETLHGWNGEGDVTPFTRIDVFDTRGLLLHVDQELTYIYTPADLALFRLVHDGIEKIKTLLDNARKEASPKGNPFLNKFKREDACYAKIESLGPSTDLIELNKLASVGADEEATLDSLREKVDALRSKATEARAELATAERDLYKSVLAALTTIQGFDRQAYAAALSGLEAAEQKHLQTTREAFAGHSIPGVLRDAWRAFIEGGEVYMQDIEANSYPSDNEPCIYCRQPLSQAAVGLLMKYRDFCNSQFKEAVQEARNNRDALAKQVRALDLARTKADLDKKRNALKAGAEPSLVLAKSLEFIALAQQLTNAVEHGKPFDNDALNSVLTELLPVLAAHMAELDKLIKELSQQSQERKQAFERELLKLRSLEARLTLRELLPQVTTHVQSAKWFDKASTILTRLGNTVGKSLTETSKIASEGLLNQNFEVCFQAECEALKAPKVRLDFPGRRGQAARRKSLVPEHKLSDILSEGEQKVLALADFIAEASLRRKASPIVFDDPVTSLDYRRLDYVVQRLVQLSESRQVIVFTHNIWFATKLLACFEKDTEACSYYDVTESAAGFGYVTRGSHPRWDTFSKTKGRINKLLEEAAAANGETQDALIERTYGCIRNITEVIVEQELFCGVTQRFSPHVAMTKLPQIKSAKLGRAIETIYPLYEKSCRIIEAHSQPLETLGTRPTLQALNEDWARLLAAREAYLKA